VPENTLSAIQRLEALFTDCQRSSNDGPEVIENMVGLGRVELPTNGLGKQTALLTRFENFGL
jgi:hypothetical protein